MPKQVDHEERRAAIVSALWKLAGERGLDRVSLRDTARGAGMSLGQLQHYFGTREDMLVFAMDFISQKVTERVTERVMALEERTPHQILRMCVAEMLPLDDRKRQGSRINISFYVEALDNERLLAHSQEGARKLLDFFEQQLSAARERREIPADRDPRREGMIMMSVIDGLTSYYHLGLHTAEEALEMAMRHLDTLFGAPGAAHETKR
ncbi:TetR/AcrR family transcriptional regulator [Allokutzneria multivorans]|uniref:TetR/AcrR family transcriptional regulator n=1 Tax=Allokutzneria multivorans TaxID=1142134 RepID=A0ABP7RK72_9PSEU